VPRPYRGRFDWVPGPGPWRAAAPSWSRNIWSPCWLPLANALLYIASQLGARRSPKLEAGAASHSLAAAEAGGAHWTSHRARGVAHAGVLRPLAPCPARLSRPVGVPAKFATRRPHDPHTQGSPEDRLGRSSVAVIRSGLGLPPSAGAGRRRRSGDRARQGYRPKHRKQLGFRIRRDSSASALAPGEPVIHPAQQAIAGPPVALQIPGLPADCGARAAPAEFDAAGRVGPLRQAPGTNFPARRRRGVSLARAFSPGLPGSAQNRRGACGSQRHGLRGEEVENRAGPSRTHHLIVVDSGRRGQQQIVNTIGCNGRTGSFKRGEGLCRWPPCRWGLITKRPMSWQGGINRRAVLLADENTSARLM